MAVVVGGLVLTGTDVAAVTSPARKILLWAVLYATKAPALFALIWAGYLLENTDAVAPRVTGLAAVASLITAAGIGLVTAPVLGGVGVVSSLTAAEAAQAILIAARAYPAGRHPLSGSRVGQPAPLAAPSSRSARSLKVRRQRHRSDVTGCSLAIMRRRDSQRPLARRRYRPPASAARATIDPRQRRPAPAPTQKDIW